MYCFKDDFDFQTASQQEKVVVSNQQVDMYCFKDDLDFQTASQ